MSAQWLASCAPAQTWGQQSAGTSSMPCRMCVRIAASGLQLPGLQVRRGYRRVKLAGVSGLQACQGCRCVRVAGMSGLQLCQGRRRVTDAGVSGLQVCQACRCVRLAGMSDWQVRQGCWCVTIAGVSGLQACQACSCFRVAGVAWLQVSRHWLCVKVAGVLGLHVCNGCWCVGFSFLGPWLRLWAHCVLDHCLHPSYRGSLTLDTWPRSHPPSGPGLLHAYPEKSGPRPLALQLRC